MGSPGADEPIRSTLAEPVRVDEMLYEELKRIRPKAFKDFTLQPKAKKCSQEENLAAMYRILGSESGPEGGPLSALCLSGGGIRSATFNLGMIQKLGQLKLLGKFDYLSSVSGGGYIASWLRTWMFRTGSDEVLKQLDQCRSNNPLATEPAPISNLRSFSNYLTPHLGLFSGDTWAAAAIVLRNMIVNWLVIVPLLAVFIGIPQLMLLAVRTEIAPGSLGHTMLWIALGLEWLAATLVYFFRSCAQRAHRNKKPLRQHHFVGLCTIPVVIAAAALAAAGVVMDATEFRHTSSLWLFAVVWCAVVPIMGWGVSQVVVRILSERQARLAREEAAKQSEKSSVHESSPGDKARLDERKPQSERAEKRASWGYELSALFVSGLAAAAILVGVTNYWYEPLIARPVWFVICALPVLLGIYLIARALFVVLASLSEGLFGKVRHGACDDNDREWWARMSGWILLVIVSWALVTAVCLLGIYVPEYTQKLIAAWTSGSDPSLTRRVVEGIIAVLGGGSGIAAALVGSHERVEVGSGASAPSLKDRMIQATAAPLFGVCMVILLALGTSKLGEVVTGQSNLFALASDFHRGTPVLSVDVGLQFFCMLVGLTLFALVMGRIVNVNRFSLHGMYRNRLVRAYLGASNQERRPDPFTGFAWSDNPKLHELWQPGSKQTATKPLPIINTTLNLVQGEKLAWQERKAESFSMTPFYCGSYQQGYRNSREYGGPTGISVGTAVAISGAAANPNMGFNSSPVYGFLMALFNLRLGAWLANTNSHGNTYTQFPGPRQAIRPFLAEIFGLTNERSPYVNLSDGGHFDNLGLYEVVLRRCRHVLVCDAGHDASFAFEDLGNAIRKIRIDFGIQVEFKKKIAIRPKSVTEPGLYCALARIRYSEIDKTKQDDDGYLIYIKPTLRGAGSAVPYDVYSYSCSSKDFPHESTSDQFFSESQFESYRALGFHTLQEVSDGAETLDFEQLLEHVRRFVDSDGRKSNVRKIRRPLSTSRPAREAARH
jgi:hypothetical protein